MTDEFIIKSSQIAAVETILAAVKTQIPEPAIVPEPTPEGTAPTASFTATPLAGTSPLEVQFTDTSVGTAPLTYKWDMNDGAGNLPENVQQNPKWRFYDVKSYTIKLTVTNPYGTHTLTKINYITVGTTQNATPLPEPTPTTTGDTIPEFGAPETVGGYAIGGG